VVIFAAQERLRDPKRHSVARRHGADPAARHNSRLAMLLSHPSSSGCDLRRRRSRLAQLADAALLSMSEQALMTLASAVSCPGKAIA